MYIMYEELSPFPSPGGLLLLYPYNMGSYSQHLPSVNLKNLE